MSSETKPIINISFDTFIPIPHVIEVYLDIIHPSQGLIENEEIYEEELDDDELQLTEEELSILKSAIKELDQNSPDLYI